MAVDILYEKEKGDLKVESAEEYIRQRVIELLSFITRESRFTYKQAWEMLAKVLNQEK